MQSRDEALGQIRDRCLELAPRPEPDWEEERPRAPRGRRVSESTRRTFPLVPRWRVAGNPVRRAAQRPSRPGLRRRRLARVRAGRSGLEDRLVRVRPPLVGARRRRVRRPREVRGGSAARRRALRPPAVDGALPARVPVAVQARRGLRGGRRDRRQRARRARRDRVPRLRGERAARGRSVLAPAEQGGVAAGRSKSGSRLQEFDAPEDNVERALDQLARRARRSAVRKLRVRRVGLPRAAAARDLAARAIAALGPRPRDRPGPRLGAELPRARVGDRAVRRAGDRARRRCAPVAVGSACAPRRERGATRAAARRASRRRSRPARRSARATRSRSTASSSRGPSCGGRDEGARDEPPAPARDRGPRGGVRGRARARRDARRWRRRRAGAAQRRCDLDVARTEPALLRRPRHGARAGAREPSRARSGHRPSGGDVCAVLDRRPATGVALDERSDDVDRRALHAPVLGRGVPAAARRDRAAEASGAHEAEQRQPRHVQPQLAAASTSSRVWRRPRSRPTRRRGGSSSRCRRSRTAWRPGCWPRRSRSRPCCSCSARSRSWCERSRDGAGCCTSGRASASSLARALELARASAARGPDDRRRALALLARVLAFDPNGGRRLAPAAARLAWGRSEPSTTGLESLVDEIERNGGRPMTPARDPARRRAQPARARAPHHAHPHRGSDRCSSRWRLPRCCSGDTRRCARRPLPAEALERDRRARPLREHLPRHVRADRRDAATSSPSRAAATASSCSRTPRTRRSRPGRPSEALRPLLGYFTLRAASTEGFLPTFPANPWANSFSAGTKISTGLELARGVIIDEAPDEKPAVLLVSDLENDPADVPRVTSVALAYRREGIPLDVVALNPAPGDEQLYRRLVRGCGLLHAGSVARRANGGVVAWLVPARPRRDRARGRAAARRVRALVGAAHVGEPPAAGRRRVRAFAPDRRRARARARSPPRAARGRRSIVARHDASGRPALPAVVGDRGGLGHVDASALGRRAQRARRRRRPGAQARRRRVSRGRPRARVLAVARARRGRGRRSRTSPRAATPPAHASQAFDLLGILAFSDSTSGPARDAGRAEPRRVRERCPARSGNTAAKYNLELLLRLLEAEGERRGPNAAPGPRGTGRRGAGAGTPGQGY